MSRNRPSRNRKRVQPAKKIERQGIALIAKAVADMGHLWNETQNDFGTDGFVEIVDGNTEKATNRIVLVQSKATSVAFGDRPIGFTCDQDDLRYWLHGNAPVILVRSHPSDGEAYWVSIKDYFGAHPEQRESRRILFDRETDRFDIDSAASLSELAKPRLDGLHLGTPPTHETLVTNLLPVEKLPDQIYVADAVIQRGRDAQRVWKDAAGSWPWDWLVWSRRLYSFTDPSEGMLADLCRGPVSAFPTVEWTRADDERRRHLVWLLKGALTGQTRPALRSNKDLTWVAAAGELPLVIDIPDLSTTRTLVGEHRRKDGSFRYIRHLAFAPSFVRYDGQWYLELTPSYHFTKDGREPDFYAASHRSGIKRIERFSDFRRNVDTLARILRGDVDLGGLTPDPEDQLLRFGELARVQLNTGHEDQDDVASISIDKKGLDGRAAA